MVVKNQAALVEACLSSVVPLIDYWVICDIGSTDGTADVIRDFFKAHGKPGALHVRPWKDYAHNRNEALDLARPHGEHVLLIDADLRIEAGETAGPLQLGADGYTVEIRDGDSSWQSVQIVRSSLPWRYDGVLYEVLRCGGAPLLKTLPLVLRRDQAAARRREASSYLEDAAILQVAGLGESDPFMRARYSFYLGQSYFDGGRPEAALRAYVERAGMGFGQEEVFISRLRAAQIKERLEYPEAEVIEAYLSAADALPSRAEAWHGAARYCRAKGLNARGYEIAERGLKVAALGPGLHVQDWIYRYGLRDEYAVNGYWAGKYRECLQACETLLGLGDDLPAGERSRVAANAGFAREKLQAESRDETARGTAIIRVENEDGQWRTMVSASSQMPRWLVFAAAQPGYVHAAALREIVEAVFYGLAQHDVAVELVSDVARLNETSIIIGAHLLSADECRRVPDGAIVYNSEHNGSDWFTPHYSEMLRRVVVWDYSADNAAALEMLLARPVRWVPLGYVPQFTRIAKRHEDIDILFFGSHKPRRGLVLDDLRQRGLHVHHAFGVYGRERDELIARAKVVLNIHQHMPGAFEIVRVAYLLANRKAVVSELNAGETVDADLADAMVTAPYEEIAGVAAGLVADAQARRGYETKGFARFSQRYEAVILRDAIEGSGKGLGMG